MLSPGGGGQPRRRPRSSKVRAYGHRATAVGELCGVTVVAGWPSEVFPVGGIRVLIKGHLMRGAPAGVPERNSCLSDVKITELMPPT